MRKELLLTIAALTLHPALRSQVINDWEDRTGVVSNMEEGTVNEDDYMASGIFSSWDSILKDYSKTKNTRKSDLEKEIREIRDEDTVHHTTTVTDRNGTQYTLPMILAEDGTDMYLLTNEGINIYMVLDAPVYFQEIDDEIVRWIRYYAYTKKRYTKIMFKRYEPWENHIKEHFRSKGVPAELAELCLIESGCTYGARSSAGAVGMWQIMPATGRAYGMRIDGNTDDRLDPVASTLTAAKILLKNYERTGEWTLAAAAYNCGAGRFTSARNRGLPWSSVKPSLPKETQQYIPGLIAMHYVWTYRRELGLEN